MGFISNQKVVVTNAPLMFVCVARTVLDKTANSFFPLILCIVSSSTVKHDQ